LKRVASGGRLSRERCRGHGQDYEPVELTFHVEITVVMTNRIAWFTWLPLTKPASQCSRTNHTCAEQDGSCPSRPDQSTALSTPISVAPLFFSIIGLLTAVKHRHPVLHRNALSTASTLKSDLRVPVDSSHRIRPKKSAGLQQFACYCLPATLRRVCDKPGA
jgi:hypothetical protein